MKRIIIILLTLCLVLKTYGQIDDSTTKKLIIKLKEAFLKNEEANEGFSPTNMMFANFEVFEAKNDIGFMTIRKLVQSKKFKTSKDAFNWLLPKINKQFIEEFSEDKNPSIVKYKPIFKKLNVHVCKCVEMASKSKDVQADLSVKNCLTNYFNDTALIPEYLSTFNSLNSEDKKEFLIAAYLYSQSNCDLLLNSSLKLVKSDVPSFYEESFESYKIKLLEKITLYNKNNQQDSLKQIFPTLNANIEAVKQLITAYKGNNYKVRYNYEILLKEKDLERYSSYLVGILPNKKIKLLGQAVYEIKLDKLLPELSSLKFYPKEKIQGNLKIEAELQKSIPDDYFN